MSTEELAQFIHKTYADLAPRYGFPNGGVPWEQMPSMNQKLMIAVSEAVLEQLFPTQVLDSRHLYDNNKQCTKCMSFINEPGGGPDEECPIS